MSYFNEDELKVLKRNIAAVQRVILNVRAYDKILEADTRHKGIDFIQLAYRALFNDFTSNAIKVLEGHNGGKARSFWWVYRKNKNDIDSFVKENEIDWVLLKRVSEKLHIIRNGTHFHFSYQYENDYKNVWKTADLKGDEFLNAMDSLWAILTYLCKKGDMVIPTLEYYGEDAKECAKFISKL